ncbi:protein YgfX [Pseudomonas sp. NBRC 111119]|uniref:protein YgfX n=1 Tax=Pseudomonas sp. NBRC 111119 TaxID=1661034 RepID=UPI0007610F4D|nr:protein YgfX [Pseudomonas sp. NBRC 111119]
MSSPSECFECRWQGSRLLLAAYLTCQLLAWLAALLGPLPWWAGLGAICACVAHGAWVVPRRILLSHGDAVVGLRRDGRGWWVFSRAQGWRAVRLCRDSMALPALVVLRFVPVGGWVGRSQCIPCDALEGDEHRRLRVRLKFSRRRWVDPGQG